MSERLIKIVNDALVKNGMKELSEKSDLSPGAIHKIASGGRIPRRRSAYKLAVAAGCSEEEALALAYECSPEANKRTA